MMPFQPKYARQIGPRLRVIVDDSACIMLEIDRHDGIAVRVAVSNASAVIDALMQARQIIRLEEDDDLSLEVLPAVLRDLGWTVE